uniref:Large ribosomal subunit protein mL40 n=1 Tax=Timema cristinae TaxID=61476 RepID=A0A7R9H9U0_TIMCR|nr:unnamed protein product [Timema cristinae]
MKRKHQCDHEWCQNKTKGGLDHTTSSGLMLVQTSKTAPSEIAEPLKKKKKLDPAILKQREDRKRKKIEKQIRRMEKNVRQLKPIDELEVPIKLIDEKV